MDINEFISKVHLNPPIWDKRVTEHSNRNIVDACWRNISSEMKTDGVALRKKWKYLRDQFSVESSKRKPPRPGDAAKTYTESKWPYFKNMLFLKDIVTPRASSSNLKPKALTITVNTEIEDDVSQSVLNENETKNTELDVEERAHTDNATEIQPVEFDQTLLENSSGSQLIRKRKCVSATKNLLHEKILALEQKKVGTIQNAFQREPESDDSMFFKSSMPFVSKIPTQKKLRFWSRIQEVVEEFAFGGGVVNQPSPGLSTSGKSTPLPSPVLSSSSYDRSMTSPIDNYQQMLPATQGAFLQNQKAFPGSSICSQDQNMYGSNFQQSY